MQAASHAEAIAPATNGSGSHEELLACAKLLALSVAEHRAKFGVIPLASHAVQIEKLVQFPHTPGLSDAASAAFSEALQLVKTRPLKTSEQKLQADVLVADEGNDKRRQLRISVTAPVQLSDPANDWLLSATIQNISWGGAAVRCKEFSGKLEQRVCLHLPAGRNQKIAILATILRIEEAHGEPIYGLRFDSLAPEDEERLQQVLKILMSSPQHGERRAEARLVQRLEIEYGDAGEFSATLEDISASGLMLTVPEPLEINQSLLVSLSSADTPFNLSLRARVMHQTKVGNEDFEMYRVGVQFEHPDAQLKQRVSAVLEQLAALPGAASFTAQGSGVYPSLPGEDAPLA
jgi:c-di-GMP-binding flagellar brake protein YcgR